MQSCSGSHGWFGKLCFVTNIWLLKITPLFQKKTPKNQKNQTKITLNKKPQTPKSNTKLCCIIQKRASAVGGERLLHTSSCRVDFLHLGYLRVGRKQKQAIQWSDYCRHKKGGLLVCVSCDHRSGTESLCMKKYLQKTPQTWAWTVWL